MPNKFRIIVRNPEGKDNSMFTVTVLDDKLDSEAISRMLMDYVIAEFEHDLAEDNPPVWVVTSNPRKERKPCA